MMRVLLGEAINVSACVWMAVRSNSCTRACQNKRSKNIAERILFGFRGNKNFREYTCARKHRRETPSSIKKASPAEPFVRTGQNSVL